MYRLVEENKLRRLIESEMIYDELCAWGVDNWIGFDECKFPDIDDIEKKLNNFINIETLSIKDEDTMHITVDPDIISVDECYSLCKIIQKWCPNNKILVTFKGMDITIEGD